MARAKNLFSDKIQNIHNNLMECLRDSKDYSPVITGQERENFHSVLLSKILPSNFRIGSGAIIDSKGRSTGQIDAVIELPFSISFPVVTGINRLNLADTVGAAFEIKSKLNQQWDDALKKVKEVKALTRYELKSNEFAILDDLTIPPFIVGSRGFNDFESLFDRVSKVPARDRPNGVFIIESGVFFGIYGGHGTLECTGSKQSTLGFISYLYQVVQKYASKAVDLYPYSDLLKGNVDIQDKKESVN